MAKDNASASTGMSKRRYALLMGLRALGLGIALLLVGFFWWQWLITLGSVVAFVGVVWLLMSPVASSEPMSHAYLRHQNEVLVIMSGYVVGTFVFAYVNDMGLPLWARALSALLPVLPTVLVLRSVWRYMRNSDELERRIQTEAITIACSVTVLLTFLAGWLELARVLQLKHALIWVLPLMAFSYGIAVGWRRRKYGIKDWC